MKPRRPDRPLWEEALSRESGRTYWRSVCERLEDPAGGDEGEYPPQADEPPSGMSRRGLLELMGASIALAGLEGCIEQPLEKILPYVDQPPEVLPGVPHYYATSLVLDGLATGVLAESHEGRPTKIEGNPEHPASLGATGAIEQASVLQLYDPARARGITRDGAPSSWRAFLEDMAQGESAWFLMPPQSSPYLQSLTTKVRERMPGARFAYHTPFDRRAAYAATQRLYGAALDSHYRFDRAQVVLSLDADFLDNMPMSLRWARHFARRRRLSSPSDDMIRLYVVEPTPSSTASLADHHLPTRPSDVARVAAGVLGEVLRQGGSVEGISPGLAEALVQATPSAHRKWVQGVASDLLRHRGGSVVVAGDHQEEGTQILAHLLNVALGNLGQTVTLAPSPLIDPQGPGLAELVAAIRAGSVQRLIIIDANPLYTAPPELELARWLPQVPRSAHVSLFRNETSASCHWFVPGLHELESWGDARALDGTISFIQPLIRPLYDGRGIIEVLAPFAGDATTSAYHQLRSFWQGELGGTDAHETWQRHLQRGFIPDSAFAPVQPALRVGQVEEALRPLLVPPSQTGTELRVQRSPKVYDGRFGNNAWLQELPHPITKQTWGNAAIISPRTAADLQAENGIVLQLKVGAHTLELPALVVPGHADNCITVAAGYGRDGTETLAKGVGVNVYPVWSDRTRSYVPGVQVTRTAARRRLALTQEHWRMYGREIAMHQDLEAYRKNRDFTEAHRGEAPSLLPPQEFSGHQWAMTIDTSICTGCSSCVVACQAENNIPVVGFEGVQRSREMHWLRIDRYYTGEPEDPAVVNQPMLCQHCEKAPCEYVCPVNATVHSPSGLNEMVYNRCVGTRFCSNNCPYKVRRFNWFEYNGDGSPQKRLQRNPNVTVRARGVMEKCTYCVQRISRATIDARREGRDLAPGEVKTACQQACPTEAIQFGSLAHKDTPMVQWRQQPRIYSVLHELGTRPRTEYLAKIFNPNPELE